MINSMTVLRGPALSSVYKSNLTLSPESTSYVADALIVLNDDEIMEFGPAESLSKKIPNGVLVKTFNKCRIIKTIISSI